MSNSKIEVIATTISGSIKDWGKVHRIVPLFKKHGREDVSLHTVDSHAEAMKLTHDLIVKGRRTIISAGGSGTFNKVLEGCIDSDVGLRNITLGFLRKGSADLIGKTLGMRKTSPLRGIWRSGNFRKDSPLHREPFHQILQGHFGPIVW